MDHVKTTLAVDDDHEIALERCDCGQYSLSLGPVTVQLDEDVVRALTKLLHETIAKEAPAEDDEENMPVPSDVQ